jgi:hypothetical protein
MFTLDRNQGIQFALKYPVRLKPKWSVQFESGYPVIQYLEQY